MKADMEPESAKAGQDAGPGREPACLTQSKKPYTQPQLTVYGPVEKVTRAVGLRGSDGLTGSRIL
jgi:hypothetical protein